MEFIRIENVDLWKDKIENIYPGTKKHLDFWREMKRRCIEGVWRRDFEGYRYMPGNLYFFIHFFTIVDYNLEKQVNERTRPSLWDVSWEYSYLATSCMGFSGFDKDDLYTSHTSAKDFRDGIIDIEDVHPTAIDSEGKVKEYVTASFYLRKIHDKPLGVPMYHNDTTDAMILGSRGGGKSYFIANLIKHTLLFDGRKTYSRSLDIVADIFVAAGKSSKSRELLTKMKASLEQLELEPRLGKFNATSHPFSKDFKGSIKENSVFKHTYSLYNDGKYVDYEGSKINHGVITIENPETSAGGRYDFTAIEEVGLIPNVIKFKASHEATLRRGGKRMGYTWYIGTAGNIEKIQEARKMFTDPDKFKIHSFVDDYEFSGNIGFFLPAYYTDPKFKDRHGNTDVEKAKKSYMRERENASGNATSYQGHIMNYPIYPSEMWVREGGNVFPVEEAKLREKHLTPKNYHTVDLIWSGEDVTFKTNHKKACPYPFRDDDNAEGTVVIYDMPLKVNVKVIDEVTGREVIRYITPKDMYIVCLDPYATDAEKDRKNSLGAAYVVLNPKYYDHAQASQIIVASYVARPSAGRKAFLENIEKLLAFYGNPHRGLWYENDRGDHVKDYFEKRNKLHLLAIDSFSQSIRAKYTRYGYNIGNHIKKLDRIDKTADFLKTPFTFKGVTKIAVEWIPCVYLLREIIDFSVDSKANYDRLMAFVGAVVGINNIYNEAKANIQKDRKPLLGFFTERRRNAIHRSKAYRKSKTR